MQRMIVPDIIHNQVLIFLQETATAREAARLMADNKVSAVMIVDRGVLHGIFTERDLAAKVVAPGLDPDQVRLAAVMTRDPDTLRPERHAAQRAREDEPRRLPASAGRRRQHRRRHGFGARPLLRGARRGGGRHPRTRTRSSTAPATGCSSASAGRTGAVFLGRQGPERQRVHALAQEIGQRVIDEALAVDA